MRVQRWESDDCQEEVHYFDDHGSYLFGYNPSVLSRAEVAGVLSRIELRIGDDDGMLRADSDPDEVPEVDDSRREGGGEQLPLPIAADDGDKPVYAPRDLGWGKRRG